jgi:hypothetical protein
MKNHAKRNGDLKRTATCPFCGDEHRRGSKEQRECRQRSRRGKAPAEPAPVPAAGERHAGSPTTHYRKKAASWALAARKAKKAGWPDGKIAKRFGVSVADVRKALDD